MRTIYSAFETLCVSSRNFYIVTAAFSLLLNSSVSQAEPAVLGSLVCQQVIGIETQKYREATRASWYDAPWKTNDYEHPEYLKYALGDQYLIYGEFINSLTKADWDFIAEVRSKTPPSQVESLEALLDMRWGIIKRKYIEKSHVYGTASDPGSLLDNIWTDTEEKRKRAGYLSVIASNAARGTVVEVDQKSLAQTHAYYETNSDHRKGPPPEIHSIIEMNIDFSYHGSKGAIIPLTSPEETRRRLDEAFTHMRDTSASRKLNPESKNVVDHPYRSLQDYLRRRGIVPAECFASATTAVTARTEPSHLSAVQGDSTKGAQVTAAK